MLCLSCLDNRYPSFPVLPFSYTERETESTGHQYVNGKQASYEDEILGDSMESNCLYLDKQQ